MEQVLMAEERGRSDLLDIGRHCQYEGCNQLDFLPFKCDGCKQVFCVEHRTYKTHQCMKEERKSRIVAVCDKCSVSIEVRDNEKGYKNVIEMVLERHEKSGKCDPGRKKKPRCPVKGCKEILTFSNRMECKHCDAKTCLKHRFPADHNCESSKPVESLRSKLGGLPWGKKSGSDCGIEKGKKSSGASSSAKFPAMLRVR